MLLSVVIPAFNEEKCLTENIPRIKQALENNSDQDFTWELIVCDNNSTDQTATIARKLGATLTFEPINQIARARNRGASIARGDWLLFIDADSYPTTELIELVKAQMVADKIVGCGFTVQIIDGPLWFRIIFTLTVNPIVRLFKLAAGACLLCRRSAFAAIGGFSQTLFILEEVDFVTRLKQYGRSQRQNFIVLSKTSCSTSGRKGELYGFWHFCWFSLKLVFSPCKIPTQKKTLNIWYDGKR